MTTYTVAERKEIGEIIISQLGGFRRLSFMIGAKDFGVGEKNGEVYLCFKFKGSRKANFISITLKFNDTYFVEFKKINTSKLTVKTVSEHSGIYCDMLIDLFEASTGLYLSI